MSLSDLKNNLKTFDKTKLVELISDLYKKNNSVKEYFDFMLNPNPTELFKKYQQKIYEAFYPKRGYDLKLKDGKKAIADFKKLESSKVLLADLMLFYVECGVEFTIEFGDINEAFYSSLEKMYRQVLTLMQQENLLAQFKIRTSKIADDTKNMGWGFHDYLADTYYECYPGDLDEA